MPAGFERGEDLKSLWWDKVLKERFLSNIEDFFKRKGVQEKIVSEEDGVMERKVATLLQSHLASGLPQVGGRPLSWEVRFSGRQKFPDLRVELNGTLYFAIELKKSARGQSIPGNSVVEVGRFIKEWFATESLGLESPKDLIELLDRIYLVFVFGEKGDTEVVVGPYFAHVSGAAVTHNPRYLITAHSGEEGEFHKELRSELLKRISSQNVKSEILSEVEQFFRETQYKLVVSDYLRKVGARGGRKPPHVSQYLLTEGPTGDDMDGGGFLASGDEAGRGVFKNPSSAEKRWLRTLTFVLVPDVLGRNSNKYHLVEAVWFLKGFYLHNLRDAFSAGGQDSGTPKVWSHFLRTPNGHFVETIKKVYEEGLWRGFWEKQGIPTNNTNDLREFGQKWKEVVLEKVQNNSGKRDVKDLREEVRKKAEKILEKL